MPKRKIYFSHDGSIDDFVALLCCMAMEDIEIVGAGVINADCFVDAGVSVTRRIIDVFGKYTIEVAASIARPANQFPRVWREESYRIEALPVLNDLDEVKTPFVSIPAHEHIIQKLRQSNEKIILFAIGPLTDIAMALQAAPDIEKKIESLLWMGGSFAQIGNVVQPDHDGSAEWNVFWDPQAVADVFASDIKITMVPLHATNQCPFEPWMVQEWAKDHKYEALDLCGQMYCSLPAFVEQYYFWDTLTAAYLGKPSLATTRELSCFVHTSGRSQGRIEEGPGREVSILDKVDTIGVYEYVTGLMKSFGYNKYMR